MNQVKMSLSGDSSACAGRGGQGQTRSGFSGFCCHISGNLMQCLETELQSGRQGGSQFHCDCVYVCVVCVSVSSPALFSQR